MKKLFSFIALLGVFASLLAEQISLVCPYARISFTKVATYQVNKFRLKAVPYFNNDLISVDERPNYIIELNVDFSDENLSIDPISGYATIDLIDPTDKDDRKMRFTIHNLYTHKWAIDMPGFGRMETEVERVQDYNPLRRQVAMYAKVMNDEGKYLTSPLNITLEHRLNEVPFNVGQPKIALFPDSKVWCAYEWFSIEGNLASYGAYPLTFKKMLPDNVDVNSCKWNNNSINRGLVDGRPMWYRSKSNLPVVCER